MVITVMALLITRHRRTTATPGASISQLLHLAVQGSPAGVAVVTHKGDVVLSNTQAHALGIISDHTVRPDVWRQAHNVFTHQKPQTLDLPAGQQRTGSRVSAAGSRAPGLRGQRVARTENTRGRHGTAVGSAHRIPR